VCYAPGMLGFILETSRDLISRGGLVMWPLLTLSLLSVTLSFERCWFFIRTNRAKKLERVREMAGLLRSGDGEGAEKLAKEAGGRGKPGVYGEAVLRLRASGGQKITESAAVDTVESLRPRLERFMPTLSTIITVAPMLGILGTVLGIISSFQLLSDQSLTVDPRSVSQGIAEALITTAVGLVIAIITLFPYNALRVQVDRTLSAMESLASAAVDGLTRED